MAKMELDMEEAVPLRSQGERRKRILTYLEILMCHPYFWKAVRLFGLLVVAGCIVFSISSVPGEVSTPAGLQYTVSMDPLSNRTVAMPFIHYLMRNNDTYKEWTDIIDKTLETSLKKREMCSPFEPLGDKGKSYLNTIVKQHLECNKNNSNYYGYDVGSPCVFFHIVPKHHDGKFGDYYKSVIERKVNFSVWMRCEEIKENNDTVANIEGFAYMPNSITAYDLINSRYNMCLETIVAVKISNPKRNTFSKIACSLWGNNTKYGIPEKKLEIEFLLAIYD